MAYKRGRRDARLAGANIYLRENGEHFLRPGLIVETPAPLRSVEAPPKDDWEEWALQSLDRTRKPAPMIDQVSLGSEAGDSTLTEEQSGQNQL